MQFLICLVCLFCMLLLCHLTSPCLDCSSFKCVGGCKVTLFCLFLRSHHITYSILLIKLVDFGNPNDVLVCRIVNCICMVLNIYTPYIVVFYYIIYDFFLLIFKIMLSCHVKVWFLGSPLTKSKLREWTVV